MDKQPLFWGGYNGNVTVLLYLELITKPSFLFVNLCNASKVKVFLDILLFITINNFDSVTQRFAHLLFIMFTFCSIFLRQSDSREACLKS